MKIYNRLLLLVLVGQTISCVTKKDATMEQKINAQLTIIDSLLKSDAFSLAIAKSQDTAYYTGVGQPVPPFLTAAEDSAIIVKTKQQENIAINLAGFYALECGVGVLCNQTKEKPTDWLQRIIAGKTDTAAVLLLNRFANATWKISQPFRSLERIKRPVFTGAGFLPADEVKKDYKQVTTAAVKLFAALQDVKDSSADAQLQKIRSLLHSQAFAIEMAGFIDAGYTDSDGKDAGSKDSALIQKTVRDQKIATNVAGFYALECCTNYLVTTRNVLPSGILKSIVDNSISKEDKNLFSRFANATWKTSQPFRDLGRIERETFTPFYCLTEADIDKDWVQIKAAAKKVLAEL